MIDAHTGSGGGLFSVLRSLFGEPDRTAPETATQDRKVDRQIQAQANAGKGDPVDEVTLSPDAQRLVAQAQAGGDADDPDWNAARAKSDEDRRLQNPAAVDLSDGEKGAETARPSRVSGPLKAYLVADRLAPAKAGDVRSATDARQANGNEDESSDPDFSSESAA